MYFKVYNKQLEANIRREDIIEVLELFQQKTATFVTHALNSEEKLNRGALLFLDQVRT